MTDDDPRNRPASWRVLLIEDESLVAMLLEDALAVVGCQVIAIASRFEDAEQKARSLSFDIAVLDVNLNGKQTLRIAEVLFDRGIPFVFATGYGVEFLPEHLRNVPVLQKPFQQHDLERVLHAALSPKT